MRFVSFALLFVAVPLAFAAELRVDDDRGLRAAMEKAEAGDVIVVATGSYRGGIHVSGRSGTRENPIVLRGGNADQPPVFSGGGGTAFQFSNCSHWTIENLTVEGFPANGINLDDGGSYDTPSVGMVLRGLKILRTGPNGNHDGIKLSGLVDFRIENCRIEGWGGSAIDMVGCRDGVIEGCVLVGLDGFDQATGIQAKGGSARVKISRCHFQNAGGRGVNLGGSTGLDYFRPAVGKWEAEDIEVSDCLFEGGGAAVAFVSSRGGNVHHNRIVNPDKWVLRILQEQPVPQFGKCREGRFFRNIVITKGASPAVNIGPDTAPKTFEFKENAWFAADGRHRPDLPVEETGGVHGTPPDELEGYGPR